MVFFGVNVTVTAQSGEFAEMIEKTLNSSGGNELFPYIYETSFLSELIPLPLPLCLPFSCCPDLTEAVTPPHPCLQASALGVLEAWGALTQKSLGPAPSSLRPSVATPPSQRYLP